MIEQETRIDSLHKVDRKRRCFQIREVLKNSKDGMTAKEISKALGFPERNYAAPRLTEMKDRGEVETVDKRYDKETDRQVAVYKLKEVEI